ncbi:TetR/AcrR family transcriptional regulator [Peribacillus simplex]|uniref:HTH-type transcriptional repressor Bm3R1 n=2 Tax=Peribacillus simplex TaxID=1478 RepID=A0A9W4PJS3_9BACI|nr:TetR/AcrR family transcriptional regulator [Peribacillus simplex]MDW7614473.1 TetR/AcrR family transcriptional regulator [Peribacillus simplex]WHX92957.1 TetR/AcrR family transcriptional regulator [Peribacillus simplex]CAH0316499.1 HTH-type transcriptional repressor Bm3R1 [Peribacillus simplex]
MGMRYKDENKSESIFNAAIQLINEHGLSETSMSKIAKKAGVSSSTIYVYFENKEDMLNKLYLNVKKKMSLELLHNYDDSIPLQSAFEHALKKYTNYILTNKDDFLFIEQFANSPLLHKLSRKEGLELFEPIFSLLEKGKSQNVFKQVDTNLLHMFMFLPAMQYVKDYFGGRIELKQDNLNELVQMTWDALKA